LCLDLGCTLSEINEKMDSYELSQWMSYYAFQNNLSVPETVNSNNELSTEDEITLMKEALA
jgi:hypothetical protein